jgi:transposase
MAAGSKSPSPSQDVAVPLGDTSDETRRTLERWTRIATAPQRVVRRSRIVLAWLDGESADEISTHLHVSPPTVRLWIRRFEEGGPQALLHDAPGRGRHALIQPDVLRDRLRSANLLDASGRPISLRRAAAFLGVSAAAVWRALRKRA